MDDQAHVPSLAPGDVRHIAAIRFPDHDFSENNLPSDQLEFHLNAISSSATTTEEQALGRFTRRKLKKLATWSQWEAGERQQLDHFHDLQMYGKPCKPPANAIILRSHWQYHIKRNGKRRSRNCCDGSPKAAPVLHKIASTYSSCVDQPIQRLFFALAAASRYKVYGGDATDAYAHSPPPERPTFIALDDAYIDWYQHRFNITLDRSLVLPVQHALQGHPKSGRLWEEHINCILLGPHLQFTTTTHDRTIYTTNYNGHKVLLLRQVDDFAIACSDESIAKSIYDYIGKQLQLPTETTPPFQYLGLMDDYNGIDVKQTATSITLTCSSYISRLLTSHKWSTPSATPSTNPSPLPTDAINQIYTHVGPDEGTPAHAALSAKHGFSYRGLLGKLLYAYITARPDIGYAVVTLSKFSTCPDDTHFLLLKHVAKYLRETIDWGIVFTKPRPDDTPPASSNVPCTYDDTLSPFPKLLPLLN